MSRTADKSFCMTKRKTKATELAKIGGQDGKPSAALPVGYANLLADLKARVRAAQLRAVVSVNRELILLYWDIGRIIVEAQTTKGYGKQVVERLAEDLQKEFPGTAGSITSLKSLNAGCRWPTRLTPHQVFSFVTYLAQ